mgnify:CR=1 FL=1
MTVKGVKKPIDGINLTRICFHCYYFYSPVGGGKYWCDFQVGFSYCNGPRWEPLAYDKACSMEDWGRCPYNIKFGVQV